MKKNSCTDTRSLNAKVPVNLKLSTHYYLYQDLQITMKHSKVSIN